MGIMQPNIKKSATPVIPIKPKNKIKGPNLEKMPKVKPVQGPIRSINPIVGTHAQWISDNHNVTLPQAQMIVKKITGSK